MPSIHSPIATIIASTLLLFVPHVQAVQTTAATDEVLTLEAAVAIAQQLDPWLAGSQQSQAALLSESTAASTLPDPKISIGLANLATDTFDFGQEPMTQLKVGIAQMFPRGDSLNIRQKQLTRLSQQHPYQRQNRRANVAVIVSQHWLNAYKAQESIALIERNRNLFDQLVDVAEASYASAIGRTRQQDIVRAQLELTRLEDRLTMLNQQHDTAQRRLSEWLNEDIANETTEETTSPYRGQLLAFTLPRKLPNIELHRTLSITNSTTSESIEKTLLQHPAIVALDQKISATRTGIDLAKQKYKPEWGVNASYGYRDEDPMGRERADFLSLGVTFDLPLFTGHRQDKQVQSATAKAEAVKSEKWLQLRSMTASYETARAQLHRLDQRQALFQSQLIPQMFELAEASLTAYTHDDGSFAEVVRSRIAQLNAEIEALVIAVERQKIIAQLNYFLTTAIAPDNRTPSHSNGAAH